MAARFAFSSGRRCAGLRCVSGAIAERGASSRNDLGVGRKGPEHRPGLPLVDRKLVIHASSRRHGRHGRFLFRLGGALEPITAACLGAP
jgi:hypothetical protein